eukprot:3280813-Pleurochrysis_carterae.AAC.1
MMPTSHSPNILISPPSFFGLRDTFGTVLALPHPSALERAHALVRRKKPTGDDDARVVLVEEALDQRREAPGIGIARFKSVADVPELAQQEHELFEPFFVIPCCPIAGGGR